MKVAIVFILLFATVLCRPVKKFSSSESSEEVVRRPAAPSLRKAAEVPQYRAPPVQNAASDESTESTESTEAPVEVKSDSTDTTSSTDTASVDSQDSEDSDDDDDDDTEESETEEDDTSDSSESGESTTPAPATVAPVIVTEEPVTEAADPIVPSIVTDTDTARGDSLGGYPSDYKSIVYVEEKSYHKVPAPYKSYEYMGTEKKTAYDMTEGNEVDKSLKVYKVQALQVHSDILEEDTSTPDVESQGLDSSSSQDQDAMPRQASLPQGQASDTTTSESSSAPEEEEEEESASNDASTSQESEDEDSQSSEEATATPGVTDSESDETTESDSDEKGAGPDATTDLPVVITAK